MIMMIVVRTIPVAAGLTAITILDSKKLRRGPGWELALSVHFAQALVLIWVMLQLRGFYWLAVQELHQLKRL